MKKTTIWTIIGVVILIIVGVVIYNTAQKQEAEEVMFPKIRVGTNKIPHSGPYIVADKKGFFQEQGLDVQTEIVSTGREGLDALIGKSLEITFVAETPIANLGFQSSDVNIFATIAEGFPCDLIARKDSGILQISDLKGKRIGVQIGTMMEFLTMKFLESNGIFKEEFEIQNIGIREMVPAFLRGDFDAIITFEPFTTKAIEQLGDNAVIFGIDEITTWNISARKEFLEEHPEAIKRFLLTLIKAENYIKDNQEETNSIISEFTGLGKEILEKVWDRYNFKVVLKSNLLDLLNEQGEWILESREEDGEIPNYRALINEKYLQEIASERVDL